MNKYSKAIFYILVGALLILTSYRSYDFISRTMPKGQQLLSLAGLAAVGIGAVMWTFFFKNAAGWPKTVAVFLIGLDILGEMSLFMADVYLTTASTLGTAALTPDAINFFLIAFGAVVACNIVAGILCEVLDPESLEAAAEKEADIDIRESELQIRQIEHKSEIEARKGMAKAIKERSLAYNKERLPSVLAAWEVGANARYTSFEDTLKQGFRVGAPDEPILLTTPSQSRTFHSETVTAPACSICGSKEQVTELPTGGKICAACLQSIQLGNPTSPMGFKSHRGSLKQ